MARGIINAKPAMRLIALYLMHVERQIFESQGRRGGGSWKPDTTEWLNRKINSGLDPRINIATEALMLSMSEPEAPGQVLHIGSQHMRLGTELPYAEVTQRNRPFTRLMPTDVVRMGEIVERHIVSKFYGSPM
jgi:hypothetical protein